jgi:hypothetical protein
MPVVPTSSSSVRESTGQGHVFTGEASADALRRARLFLEKHLRPAG